MTLIGLCGKMGVGKDYIANNVILPYLRNVRKQTSITLCFADQLKVNAMSRYNLDYSSVYENKTHEVRKLLQKDGTEHGRDLHGKDIWISYLDKWMEIMKHRGIENFVITDVRFQNEMQYIKSRNGILIRIIAHERNKLRMQNEKITEAMMVHKSECDLDNVGDEYFDLTIDNDKEIDIDKIISFIK